MNFGTDFLAHEWGTHMENDGLGKISSKYFYRSTQHHTPCWDETSGHVLSKPRDTQRKRWLLWERSRPRCCYGRIARRLRLRTLLPVVEKFRLDCRREESQEFYLGRSILLFFFIKNYKYAAAVR